MRCKGFRDELLLGHAPSAELDAHVQGCEACRALLATQRSLNDVLALDEAYRPGPGFDTRFFAKLHEERLDEERAAHRKRQESFSMRMWLWALVPAAAGIALLVLHSIQAPDLPAHPPLTQAPSLLVDVAEEPDDFALLEDLELVEDLDVVQQLDALEDLEILEGVDPAELDRLAAQEGTP